MKIFGTIYIRTEAFCADIFIKCFRDLPKLQQAICLIQIVKPTTTPWKPPEAGHRQETLDKKKVAKQSLASDMTDDPEVEDAAAAAGDRA